MTRFIKTLFVMFAWMTSISFTYAMSPEEIYGSYCINCHSTEMSVIFNSPTVHDQSAWQPRRDLALERAMEKNDSLKVTNQEEKMEAILTEVLSVAQEGTDKGMPPRGTCMECSDEELKSAIKFMSSTPK